MSEPLEGRADVTRSHILDAAAQRFARHYYSRVSLDDILADARVTKGAMYFHFRSKHALAAAIIDARTEQARMEIERVLARRLSGLETLIDVSLLLAVDDIGTELARSALNLLESIGRTDGSQAALARQWVDAFAALARQAAADGDIADNRDPQAVAQLVVSMYVGLRQTSDLDDAAVFLRDLSTAWALVLPGFASPDRVAYLTQFISRRATLATKKTRPIVIDEL